MVLLISHVSLQVVLRRTVNELIGARVTDSPQRVVIVSQPRVKYFRSCPILRLILLSS